MKTKKIMLAIVSTMILSSCVSYQSMQTVKYVDIDRFMGDWYVIANIPTFIEKGAHNAVESYSKNEDGSIDTAFTFKADSFDGELKEYHPVGYIKNTATNAIWGMQFIWPIKADYRIVYLNEDYSITVIAREARDYVWLMSRECTLQPEVYESMVSFIAELGYDVSKIKRVPQDCVGRSKADGLGNEMTGVQI